MSAKHSKFSAIFKEFWPIQPQFSTDLYADALFLSNDPSSSHSLLFQLRFLFSVLIVYAKPNLRTGRETMERVVIIEGLIEIELLLSDPKIKISKLVI